MERNSMHSAFLPLAAALGMVSLFLTQAVILAAQGGDQDVFDPPPLLHLEWSGLVDDGSVLPLEDSTLELMATHHGKVPVTAVVAFDLDDGASMRIHHPEQPFELKPDETRRIAVDLQAFGLETTDMAFAGQVLASVRIEEDSTSLESMKAIPAMAPPLYFHRDAAGVLQSYGETALVETFRGGDLHGAVKAPENTVLRRVRRAEREKGHPAPWTEGSPVLRNPAGPGESSGDPSSTDRRLCIQWKIRTTDHGRILLDQDGVAFSEDYWSGLPEPISAGDKPTKKMRVKARGVWILVNQGDWAEALHTDPTTGCVNIEPPRDVPMDVHVMTVHSDKDDNYLKVVSGDLGFPYAFVEVGVAIPAPGETITVAVGDYSPTATLAAVSGFAAYREHFGLSDKEIRIEEATCGKGGKGNRSSAHYQAKADLEFSKGRARIRIHKGGDSPCSASDHRRQKFVITHEIGHAWLLLARGVDDYEQNVSRKLEDATEKVCTPVDDRYTVTSLEWDSLGGREGIAHYYAARVFNDEKEKEAMFSFFGTPRSLEPPLEQGGRLWKSCSAAAKCFKGTNIDWARFWWNWHTPYQSGLTPKASDLRKVYVRAQDNGGLVKNNYYRRYKTAMTQVVDNLDWRDTWVEDAVANGIGEGCSTFDYPDCTCWGDRDKPFPEICQGAIGCPCVDVSPVSSSEDLLTQTSAIPDGAGSYLSNGLEGAGQHCYDNRGKVVCGAIERLGTSYPVCQVCGIDTHFGCECQGDEDCQGFLEDGALSCHGGPENGWKGGSPGTCLPSAGEEKGRERLEELPWFCLDNCGSKGSGFACLFDQLKNHPGNVSLPHAQCVDVLGDGPAGFCESQPGGFFAPPGAKCPGKFKEDWMKCCHSECGPGEDWSCSDWGFPVPGAYACDYGAKKTTPAHCVPVACAGEKISQNLENFCPMYW